MIIKKISFTFLIAIFLLIGCAGITKIPEPHSPEAGLYVKKCTTCHSLPHPKRFRYKEWVHFVDLMEGTMEEKNIDFSEEDKKIILSYLKKHAR